MTKYSLRARIMILILIPTLLIGLFFGAFSVIHRYNELQNQLIQAGSNIIEPLAVASEYGIAFNDRTAVRQLVSLLHRRHSDIVRAITVFNINNEPFVTSNNKTPVALMRNAQPDKLQTGINLFRLDNGNTLVLQTPIFSESYFLDEEPEANAKADKNTLGYVAIMLDMQSVRLQQYKEILTFILLLLLCLFLATLFAYRLMRDITVPIRNMLTTIDQIRRGQLDIRVKGYMLGELNMLKEGINEMAVSLAAHHEEMQQNIEQATADLDALLYQVELKNYELKEANQRAQEASRIKSEFLANISHELRTPLNGVIGFTRQTLKTSLTPIQQEYLQNIERSANNLLTIINDVLDFSKLEAGKLMLESIPFLLRSTIDEVIVLLANSAHEKGLELTVNIHNDVPDYVVGDPLRLQQIITNLLGNAIKFTKQGNVDLCVMKRAVISHGNTRKVELEVQVHDTGIGIETHQQSELFQAFRQADASISRRHGGTGLGLVITQKLVREMDGDINFHSQINRGSTFWFHIQLEVNQNAGERTLEFTNLAGKTLGYVESNSTAAQATLDLLEITPLNVTYSPTLEKLPQETFDILLFSVPVCWQHEALESHLEAIQALQARTACLMLALPTQLQMDREIFIEHGVAICINKPITYHGLMPVLLDYSNRASVTLPPKTTPQKRLPITVMAVDDNPANLKLIGSLLEELVEQVVLCESGEEARIQASQRDLDIILMDIQMPEVDGLKASQLIREIPRHARTPIIAVTAYALGGTSEHLLQAGMNDYLAKPINETMLYNVLIRNCRLSSVPALPLPALLPDTPLPAACETELPCTLDWSLALQQSANKPELARDMLAMLVAFLPEVRHIIDTQLAATQPDHEALLHIIHKLHGSCSYCGVPRLKSLCYLLETQLRQGEPLASMEPELLELLDEIQHVTEAAQAYLHAETPAEQPSEAPA